MTEDETKEEEEQDKEGNIEEKAMIQESQPREESTASGDGTENTEAKQERTESRGPEEPIPSSQESSSSSPDEEMKAIHHHHQAPAEAMKEGEAADKSALPAVAMDPATASGLTDYVKQAGGSLYYFEGRDYTTGKSRQDRVLGKRKRSDEDPSEEEAASQSSLSSPLFFLHFPGHFFFPLCNPIIDSLIVGCLPRRCLVHRRRIGRE